MPLDLPTLTALKSALLLPGLTTHAIIDGAGCPELLDQLEMHQPEHDCLYRGALEPEVAQVAPWLVQLSHDDPFTDWLLAAGWGQAWFTLALGTEPLPLLRIHLRRLLKAQLPDGRIVYFRFYDPRVLRIYLPTCAPATVTRILGGQKALVTEDEAPDRLRIFTVTASALSSLTHTIHAGPAPIVTEPD